MNIKDVLRVPDSIDFPKEEEKILALWKELDVFKTSLKQSKGKPRYSFYDGPPFATGLPHYGHILASSIKDVVTRYAHQQGFHVERRFGWDCHGLPVEFEIDKALGIKGPEDVAKMGIATYNGECRKIVSRYVKEWQTIITRIGRWIDFENDYKTLYPWYMETIWWVFAQLYHKGLVYQGTKIMPYSNACNTPLSNFESGQNYKDVVDPAVTVTLPIIGDRDAASLLVWTTTPWTLPSNLAACVHPEYSYVRVKQTSSQQVFIVMEARLEFIFQQGDYEVLDTFSGSRLKGLEYEPIFSYFTNAMKKQGAFRVLVDNYVTQESGTGVVHQAPYFGEDDHRVCLANGVITRDQEPICPLDASGKFTDEVTDFRGQYIKDADKQIIAHLKANGRLFHQSQAKHSYPFCWRSDTPLIYRAVPSWFIRVEHMTDALLASNASTYWVPDFVKDKRFGNWLREARDWAVSRNRYWGTPIPIWMSPTGDEIRCIGSIAELEQLTGAKVTDLHREHVDHLEIPSRLPGRPPLKRIPEVFDCWFESGSMPYAQLHYPFENAKEFDDAFPADFIGEGIDQTRGWFYTLLVVSTSLFGKPPFKNLIANGLVLASDGQKMSKRKKNYPDPLEVVNRYGADALRLYLINSPVVRAENLRFKEEGVRDIVKDVFLPWYNAFRFLLQNIECYIVDNRTQFAYADSELLPINTMDKWILSFTHSLLDYVRQEMALYHLYTVVPRLTKYIDYLTNWYVRMNRKRLKGEGGPADCHQALTTLFNVVLNIVKMMAPFAPFLAETMYQHLKQLSNHEADSVHYLMLPQPNQALIYKDIERAVSRMQSVIELGRVLRDRNAIPIKYPLPEVVIIHQDAAYIEDVESLKAYILSELNVRSMTTTTDKRTYGVSLRAEPDHKVLGLRLKSDFKQVTLGIKAMTDNEINAMVTQGHCFISNHKIAASEVRLIFKSDEVTSSKYEVHSDNDVLVLLDITPDQSMQEEGIAREIINRIQKLRKKAQLVPTDEISVFYNTSGELARIAHEYAAFIEESIKAPLKVIAAKTNKYTPIMTEMQKLKDCTLLIELAKVSDKTKPSCLWLNVMLMGVEQRFGKKGTKGVVLLENAHKKVLSFDNFKHEVACLFGIPLNFNVFDNMGQEVCSDNSLIELHGSTVLVTRGTKLYTNISQCPEVPFCKIINSNGKVRILENPQGCPTKLSL